MWTGKLPHRFADRGPIAVRRPTRCARFLINRGTFRGHDGVRELARMLGQFLPEQRSFEYIYKAVEGKIAFLEWAYEDANVMVRDGADSFLIEDGKPRKPSLAKAGELRRPFLTG
jgi:hypothetical protein